MAPNKPKTIDFGFAEVQLFDNYIISTIKEGLVFDLEHQKKFYGIFDLYYPNKPFGYISNRKYDYTVNPTSYFEHSKYPRMVCMAVLCYNESSYRMAEFEKAFYKHPFKPFFTLEECIDWINEEITKHKKAGL